MSVISKVNIVPSIWLFIQYIAYIYKKIIRPFKDNLILGLRRLTPWILALSSSLILASLILYSEPQKILAAFSGIIIFMLILWRLEIGIITAVILAATIIHPESVPRPLTLGGQGPRATEMLIILMLFIVFFRSLYNRKFIFFKSPITAPLLLLCSTVIFSMVISYQHYMQTIPGDWSFNKTYNAARPMFHYLIFFPVAFGIRSTKQVSWTLRVMVWVATIVALAMVAEYFIAPYGKSMFIGSPWSFSQFSKQLAGDITSSDAGDIVRALPPGQALVIAMFLFTLVHAAYRGRKGGMLDAVVAAIMGIGLIFTWTRHIWISTFFAAVIVWMFSRPIIKLRLLAIFLTVVAVVAMGSIIIGQAAPGTAGAKFSRALTVRITSIFEPEKTFKSKSLENRFRENQKAITQLKEHPILGIGVGYPVHYQMFTDPYTGAAAIYPMPYMHNSWLELWLVYGIVAFVSFIWLSIAFLIRCLQLFYREQNLSTKAFAIAVFANYISFLERSVTQMHMVHDTYHMLVVAFLWGMIEVMWRLNEQRRSSSEPIAGSLSPICQKQKVRLEYLQRS